MNNIFKFTSDISKLEKDLKREHKKALRRAVAPLPKAIRANIRKNFEKQSGGLLKAPTVDIQDNYIAVGMDLRKAPHALIMELGSYRSKPRLTKGNGDKEAGISSGTLEPKPYFLPAYQSVEAKVIKNLTEEWDI